MLRRRIHIGPKFQLGKLLSSSIRNQTVITPHARFIRYRVPIICSITIPIRSMRGILRDIEYGRDGGCEDEALEGGIFSGGLQDGERSGDCGIDQSFGEGRTR